MPTLLFTASGFVNGDPASVVTGLLGTTATPASPVGSYAFTLGTLSAGSNYTLALVANPPAFAVTEATPTGFSYDLATKTLTITGSTFTFVQQTTADSAGLHVTYTFTMDLVSRSFAEAEIAHAIVNGQGAGSTATLITNDTYVGADGLARETTEFDDLGPGNSGEILKYDGSGKVFSFLEYHNFDTSYAIAGRADAGQLVGTFGLSNAFVTAGVYSYISAPGQFHYITGAAYVYGYATGSRDVAYHTDGSAASTFIVSGTAYSLMFGTDNGVSFFNEAVGFTFNEAIARHSGDVAYFFDSPRNDVFSGGANVVNYLYSDNPDGTLAEYDSAEGFGTVYATASVDGTDYAYNDSSNTAILVGWVLLSTRAR